MCLRLFFGLLLLFCFRSTNTKTKSVLSVGCTPAHRKRDESKADKILQQPSYFARACSCTANYELYGIVYFLYLVQRTTYSTLY